MKNKLGKNQIKHFNSLSREELIIIFYEQKEEYRKLLNIAACGRVSEDKINAIKIRIDYIEDLLKNK